jgi:hypothetical protein
MVSKHGRLKTKDACYSAYGYIFLDVFVFFLRLLTVRQDSYLVHVHTAVFILLDNVNQQQGGGN